MILDMSPYCEAGVDKDDTTYELFSVVIHSGSTHSGHYTAYIRDVDDLGQWSHPVSKRCGHCIAYIILGNMEQWPACVVCGVWRVCVCVWPVCVASVCGLRVWPACVACVCGLRVWAGRHVLCLACKRI